MNGYREKYKIALGWDIVMKPAALYTGKVYEGNWIEFDEDGKANVLSAIPDHAAVYPVLKGSHFIVSGEEFKSPDVSESGKIVYVLGEHVVETELFEASPNNGWATEGLPVFLKYDGTPTDEHKRFLLTTDEQGVATTENYVIGYLHKPKKSTDTKVHVRVTVPGIIIETPA